MPTNSNLRLAQRCGKVKTIVIPNTSGIIIQPIIKEIVKKGGILLTDEWHASLFTGTIEYQQLIAR